MGKVENASSDCSGEHGRTAAQARRRDQHACGDVSGQDAARFVFPACHLGHSAGLATLRCLFFDAEHG